MSFARIFYTGHITLGFMMWNLILAIIPFGISLIIDGMNPGTVSKENEEKDDVSRHEKRTKITMVCLGFVWLVFFPNAPYMMTDLFHLHPRTNVPFWFDLVLLTTYAWNGLLLGYISLFLIHQKVRLFFGKLTGWLFAFSCLSLSGFGIYLGRYLRWNTWDIITHPMHLLNDILDRFIHPFSHPRTWMLTILVSMFLVLGYAAIHQLTKLRLNESN